MKKMLFYSLLVPVFVFAQSQKKYTSLLWKITGNGLKKPSYLYGTMHVSNRVAYHLSEQFFDALKSVDAVGLETNPGEWLANMEKTGELLELNQLRGFNYSNKNFYKNAFTVYFPEKKVLQSMLSYDPDIIDGLLYRQNKTHENFEESTYIDLFIFQSASKLNKQIISLEDFATSEIKARLSALPDEGEDDREIHKDYYLLSKKIEDAYRDGNLDMLDSLSKLSSSKNTQRFLINDRNVFFVNTMDSVLKTKTLFSGVGAAHLPGENGVIELLRKKGYAVEPLTPEVSEKSHNTREKLDAQLKAVTFQKQSVSDSVFSVNLPGKLYQIVNFDNIKYYICPDMVNGNFYTISRLKYFGPLFNVSARQMMQKTDSLLFEYVPGKIISKKEIALSNGTKGLEIINQTRRGDIQHYQLFFTDLEMIMFKLGGKGKYAIGSEAKQFFNSIKITAKSEETIDFSPTTKGFSVKIPGNYFYSKNDGSSLTGNVEDLYAYNKSRKQFFGLKQAVYNDFNYLEEDTFELNQLSKNILLNFNFKENASYENLKEQGFPCSKFKGKNQNGLTFYGKIFIKGVHYYLLYCVSEKEMNFDDEFFSSFKLMDFNYINPIKEITDVDFYFKVKDEVSNNSLSRFNEAYAKAYKESRPKRDSVVKPDFDYRSNSKYYYSPSSNEYVNINLEKYNDYDFRDLKKADKYLVENLKTNTTLFVAKKDSVEKNGIYQFNYLLKDTATARAIDYRVFFKNGVMQEISAPYDTTIGLRGWTKDFMESFTPLDTVIGVDIFKNKFNKLLQDLSCSDTTLRREANISLINALGMQKEYTDDFVKFLGSSKIDSVNEDSRAQLFVNGGILGSEKIIEPYKKLYKQYTDSFYLQLCLLKGLAFLNTQNSFDAIYDLLIRETPLVGAENTVSDIFVPMRDSIELCKKFFPGIFSLTKYDEYQASVYSLLADLVDKKIIAPQSYAAQKEAILMDANLALKRYNPANSKSSSSGDYYLENSSRELADIIKANLDGLSNNNLFGGKKELKAWEANVREPLVNFAYILLPFYKSDEKTKQFFAKLSKIKSQNVAMPVAIHLLKQNIILNDTLILFYSKNKNTRAFFYSELEKASLTDKFNKNYLSQNSLNESVLSSQRQLDNIYNKDKSQNDSLVLVKELWAKNKYQNGKLYIYKTSKFKDEERWSAVFINDPKDTVSSKIEIVHSGYMIDRAKTEQENINELLDYFSLTYRKRAMPNSGSY